MLDSVDPFPSWPTELSPQQKASPPESITHVWSSPAPIVAEWAGTNAVARTSKKAGPGDKCRLPNNVFINLDFFSSVFEHGVFPNEFPVEQHDQGVCRCVACTCPCRMRRRWRVSCCAASIPMRARPCLTAVRLTAGSFRTGQSIRQKSNHRVSEAHTAVAANGLKCDRAVIDAAPPGTGLAHVPNILIKAWYPMIK